VKLAFRLQKIEQIEDKTVTLVYNRQSAVRRTYAPQGLIGLLADDLEGPPHFIEVDLDSPFFRNLDIEIEAPPAFDQIGLLRTDVAIEYGSKSDPVGVKHKDISFRATGARVEKASFFLNPSLDLSYRLKIQYHFDPLSGWDGEMLSYDLPAGSSLDRTLLLNPFRDFGFMSLRVIAGDLDPGMIDSTDVLLHYEDQGKWARDKVITVKPGSAEQTWKLRLSDPNKRQFSYSLSHRLKDGTTREVPAVVSDIPLITVNDPFQEPLIVEFFPNYDASNLKLLIVDVTFEDPELSLKRQQRLEFTAVSLDSQRLRFARSGPSVNRFSFQITILGSDNSVRRLPAVNSESTIIFIGEHLGFETSSRRSVMGNSSNEVMNTYQGGKTYGYQQPQEASGATSAIAVGKQKVLLALGELIDSLAAADGAASPEPSKPPAGNTGIVPPPLGSPPTGTGYTAPTGTGYTAPTPGKGSTAPSTGNGGYVGATTTTSTSSGGGAAPSKGYPNGKSSSGEASGSTGKSNGSGVEAQAVSIAAQREAFRADRARETARAAAHHETAPVTTVARSNGARPAVVGLDNSHQSDSNRAPLTSSREFAHSFGSKGRSLGPTLEKMALPVARPETVPAAGAIGSARPIDAYWASFGTAVDRAAARARMQTQLEVIIGTDDRVIVPNTTEYPWRCVCSLLITAQNSTQWIGTGWLVAPRLVLTAGHCVYMADEGGWASQIEVVPGRNADVRPYGSVISRDLRSVTGWTNGNDSDVDYGAILLPEDSRLGEQLGWFGFASRTDDQLRATTLNVSGYPGDGGKTGVQGTQWYDTRGVKDVDERQISYEMDTFGGQSGAPVWELGSDGGRYGLAIHTHGATVSNGATRITREVFDNIVLWAGQAP